jgi:hypothetical protein
MDDPSTRWTTMVEWGSEKVTLSTICRRKEEVSDLHQILKHCDVRVQTYTTDPAGLVTEKDVCTVNVLLKTETAVCKEVGREGECARTETGVSKTTSEDLTVLLRLTCKGMLGGGG